MAKVHITLVGGQAMPVYNVIMALKPDRVIYVYSKQSAEKMSILKQEINIPSKELLLSVDEIKDIIISANTLAEQLVNNEVSVKVLPSATAS